MFLISTKSAIFVCVCVWKCFVVSYLLKFLFVTFMFIKLAEMEARVVGAETRAEIAEEKVRFVSSLCW